uniref:Uncharacterized protein n=1 Tax=Parascaris equorum TaxID=6256 RepID=A0A914RK66_PAREQ
MVRYFTSGQNAHFVRHKWSLSMGGIDERDESGKHHCYPYSSFALRGKKH